MLGPQRTKAWMDTAYGLRTRLLRISRRLRTGTDHVPLSPELEAFGDDRHHYFFGYYDISPSSYDDTFLLACRMPVEKSDGALEVGYFDIRNPNSHFLLLDRTDTWSWQLGCRYQWYPLGYSGKETSPNVIYNVFLDGRYGFCVRNLKTGDIQKQFPVPIFSLTPDGCIGLSLNFSRLGRLRPGYGYLALPDDTAGIDIPENDGVRRIDMDSGKTELIVSIATAARLEPLPSMQGAVHYFNHLCVNSDGSRFLFFHVWINDHKRYTRLITSDMEGQNLVVLTNEGFVSHYAWRKPNEVLCYSEHAGTGRKYHLYKDFSDERRVIGNGCLGRDGHPSFSPDGRYLLTDTYPDKYGERQLMAYHLKSGDLFQLGAFFSPYHLSGHRRCDLHPRWSPSGKYIVFDSAHRGYRAIYRLPFDSAKND